MENRKLGRDGPSVFPIGLGCMSIGIGDVYTSSARDDNAGIDLIHRALDLGVTHLDTANSYGTSELQVGKALAGRRDGVIVATKFGFVTKKDGSGRRIDGTPDNVRYACDESLQRLKIDYIDLYYLHRVDPQVPIEETVGAMAGLVERGKVKHLGLSEANPETIRRAHAVHSIAAVQTEYSLWTRDPEDELIPTLRELEIALVAYSPLGRGFLAGRFRTVDDMAPDDWRRGNPRFQGENFAKNVALVDHVRQLADEKECTPAQLALAWLVTRDANVIPIPGTSKVERLEENLAALNVRLTPGDMDRIERAAPKGIASGSRYDAAMSTLING